MPFPIIPVLGAVGSWISSMFEKAHSTGLALSDIGLFNTILVIDTYNKDPKKGLAAYDGLKAIILNRQNTFTSAEKASLNPFLELIAKRDFKPFPTYMGIPDLNANTRGVDIVPNATPPINPNGIPTSTTDPNNESSSMMFWGIGTTIVVVILALIFGKK